MINMKNNKENKIELEDEDMQYVIIRIPKYCYELNIDASFLREEDYEEHVAHMEMNYEMIQKARQDFLDNVEDGDEYDVRYCLTDKGRAWLDMYDDLHEKEV